jgi:hypothetical protein
MKFAITSSLGGIAAMTTFAGTSSAVNLKNYYGRGCLGDFLMCRNIKPNYCCAGPIDLEYESGSCIGCPGNGGHRM